MNNVATTKLYESDKLIVWNMTLEPNESTGLHTHYNDYMFHATQGSVIEVQDADGNYLTTITVNTGDTLEFRIDGDQLVALDPSIPSLPITHQAYNRGDSTYKEILVETKK